MHRLVERRWLLDERDIGDPPGPSDEDLQPHHRAEHEHREDWPGADEDAGEPAGAGLERHRDQLDDLHHGGGEPEHERAERERRPRALVPGLDPLQPGRLQERADDDEGVDYRALGDARVCRQLSARVPQAMAVQ